MSKDIYLMGICGTGVGALAGMLKQLGHRVRGSDEHVYPPMSDKLRDWGITVHEGFRADNLVPQPELVVVGNVIRAVNPEAEAMRARGLPHMSMPQAIAEFGIGDKHSVVVTGTHGKTTVTALTAHVLQEAGTDPSYLVGGVPVGQEESFRVGRGPFFVVEGDEYDTAYFDKGPKFLHYRPSTAMITSLEFDHADIYASVEAIESSFRKLIGIMPRSGHLVVWAGADRAVRLLDELSPPCAVTRYGLRPAPGVDLWVEGLQAGPSGLRFEAILRGKSLGLMDVPLWGDHSACNALAVIAALVVADVPAEAVARGLKTFAGVRRRLEVRGEPGGVTVVDDFAHHPTAIAATLAAARVRWPGRRMWAVFEPRSATTRRNVFQRDLVEAFAGADRVVVGSHPRLQEIPEAERFSPGQLARDLEMAGTPCLAEPDVDRIVAHIVAEARSGDVVMVLSNGAFDGLHGKLLGALGEPVR